MSSWGGKILGGMIGMLAMGPWGAVLGAVIGHQFDTAVDRPLRDAPPPHPATVNRLFFPATFRVMGHIAKADGRISEQEIAAARAVMAALRLDALQIRAAIEYYGEGKQPGFDLDAELRALRAGLLYFPELAQFFVEIQLQAAIAGNNLAGPSRGRMQRTAQLLGLHTAEFLQLERLMRAQSAQAQASSTQQQNLNLAQAYQQLDVAPGASDEAVTKAYRRQMSRHHPDKLQASGLPESMLERAKERTQQIRAAYELIRARRGLA